jgi:hypothetical protein
MKRHHPHARRRRAFAVIFALFLIALVGAALLALTSLMTTDARRSTRDAVDAQLRQLLHAGAVAAVQQMRNANELPPETGFDVALPREPGGALAQIHVSRGPAGHAMIDARLGDRTARQQVELVRDGGVWQVKSVQQ